MSSGSSSGADADGEQQRRRPSFDLFAYKPKQSGTGPAKRSPSPSLPRSSSSAPLGSSPPGSDLMSSSLTDIRGGIQQRRGNARSRLFQNANHGSLNLGSGKSLTPQSLSGTAPRMLRHNSIRFDRRSSDSDSVSDVGLRGAEEAAANNLTNSSNMVAVHVVDHVVDLRPRRASRVSNDAWRGSYNTGASSNTKESSSLISVDSLSSSSAASDRDDKTRNSLKMSARIIIQKGIMEDIINEANSKADTNDYGDDDTNGSKAKEANNKGAACARGSSRAYEPTREDVEEVSITSMPKHWEKGGKAARRTSRNSMASMFGGKSISSDDVGKGDESNRYIGDAADNFSLGSDDAVKTPPLRRGTFLHRCVTVFATFVVLATLSGSVLVYFLPKEELAELLRILLASKPLGRLAVGEVRDAGLQHRAADVAYEGAGMHYLYGREDVVYDDVAYEDAEMHYAGVAGQAWGHQGDLEY